MEDVIDIPAGDACGNCQFIVACHGVVEPYCSLFPEEMLGWDAKREWLRCLACSDGYPDGATVTILAK